MMNKGRKTNNRAGQGSNNNRSSPRSRGAIAEGVYNNSHFLHAAASQVGNNVLVKTKGGVVVEGIFRTFSEHFHIALEVPHRYQNGADDKKINVDTVQDNLIIKLCDIVTIEAKDVDLEYATRDTFQTDAAIASRINGQVRLGEKELQPWMDGMDLNGGDSGINLELDTKTNGWDANEMFQLNEKEHGIKSTFKDNLESYTVQIERKDTQDFRKQELEAERIAAEIENNPSTKDRLDVENGDEEAVFAAVVRPEDQTSTNSASNMMNNDKMTPPPSSQQQPQQQQPQQQPQQKYIPKQQRNQGKMMPNKMYPKQMQTSGSGPQPVVQQTINAGGFKTMTINPPSQAQYSQPPPTHYVTQQQQQQNSNQMHSSQDGGNKMNGEGRNENSNNKSMPRANMRIMNPQIPVSFSEPPPSLNQQMVKPLQAMHIPPPHLQAEVGQQPIHVVPQQVVLVATHQIPSHAAPPPQPQRPNRDVMRSRTEEMRSLRQFHNEFNLALPASQQQQAPTQVPPQQSSQAIQTIPQQQQQQSIRSVELQDVSGQSGMVVVQQSGPVNSVALVDNSQQVQATQQHISNIKSQQHVNSNVNHHVTHHPTPSSTPHQEKSHTPPQANTPHQQQQQNVNSSNVNSSSNSSSNASNDSISGNTAGNNNDKGALGTKTFKLNPQAKPFTPRMNPSTPTQSRPHTPQTPSPMVQQQQQQQQAQQQGPTVAQQQIPNPYPAGAPVVYCLVQPQQRPTPPPALTRKTQFQQFQVTQATGQPIFNPPVPPQAVMPYPHPSQMQTVHSQTYPPAIRMYSHSHDAQQQPHITSYLVPTPPSTTPSPGQAHQPTFHPAQPQPTQPPTAQGFQAGPGQYVMLMHSNPPPFVYNQHNPQQFQIVSNAALPQQQNHQ